MQIHTKTGIRESTPAEDAAIKATEKRNKDDDKLIEYAKAHGWIA